MAIDPVIVRLFFILLALGSGFGVLIYVVLWIVTPLEGEGDEAATAGGLRPGADEIAERARAMGGELHSAVSKPNPQAGLIVGAALIILGGMWLLQNVFEGLDIFWLRWFNLHTLWPLLLIVGGAALLWRLARKE